MRKTPTDATRARQRYNYNALFSLASASFSRLGRSPTRIRLVLMAK